MISQPQPNSVSAALTALKESLSPAQLRELRSLIPAEDNDGSHGRLYTAMVDVLRARGVLQCPPMKVFLKTGYGKAFASNAQPFIDYVMLAFAPKNKIYQQKALLVVLEVICDWVAERAPLSITSLSRALSRASDIVDTSFPGYRESGMLSILLTAQRQ